MKNTMKTLRERLKSICSRYDLKLELRAQTNMPGIRCQLESQDRTLSPNYTVRDMDTYLRGFIDALALSATNKTSPQ